MRNIITLLVVCFTTITFAQEVKFGKVSKAELEEKFYPGDSLAEAAYLLRKRSTYYAYNKNKGFTVVTEVHNRLKIYTKDGFDKANIYIPYYSLSENRESVSSVKGYTYSIDNGKIEKEKISKSNIFDEKRNKYYNVKKIAMPNVREGSIIEWKYKLVSPRYWNIDDAEFQFDIPVKQLDYNIEHPEWFIFDKTPKGYFLVTPRMSKRSGSISSSSRVRSETRRSTGGVATSSNVVTNTTNLLYDKTVFNAKNIPALRAGEPFVSNIRNYRGGMKYELSAVNYPNSPVKTFSRTWENVAKEIYKLESFGGELRKTSFYKSDLDALLANASSDNEKISAVFEFVKSKIKWNGYTGKYPESSIRKAYKEGSGNSGAINLLLTSMLREAGFNANPVLTSTRRNGVPLFPTMDGFNYVIASITTPNGIMLLDATDEYSGVNVLPLRVMNWNGRLVRPDGSSSAIGLVPKRHRLEDNFVNVKLTDDGMVEGMVRTKYTGLNAMNYRKRNNVLKEDDVIAKLEENYSIEIDNFKVTNEKNIYKPLARLFKFSSEDLVEDISGKLYVKPLLFFGFENNPFKIDERKYPVDFGIPWKDKNSITIQIPEGYKVESIPEVAAIGLPDGLGLFKYQVKVTGNKIKVISILQFNQGVILPQYYKQLKDFFKQIVEKQTEKIVISKS